MRLAFGVMRWMSVKPLTSMSALLTPTAAMATSATSRVHDEADDGDRRAPAGQGEPERRGQAVATGQGDRHDRSEEPAQAHGRVERPDARFAHPQELDGGDDDEDGEQPADEGLQPESRRR